MLTIKGLTPLEHYRLRVAHKPEIVEDEIAPGVVCFSVMKGIGNSDTYHDSWTREARGITFDAKTGEIISRPFHKFFNLNERESTQISALDWSKVVRVMDKRDGSMIHPVLIDGYIKLKSKKTFDSDVAVEAQKFISGTDYHGFCEQLLRHHNCTPIFEWTSPVQRIVLGYATPELKLTHIRSNIKGRYWPLSMIKEVAASWKIPLVDEVTEFSSFEQMLEAAKTREGVEGWVIQFEDGEMVKVKTEWYMKRHRAMTFFRERDIVELILDEQLDDVKSMLAGDGIDIGPILDVEKKFGNDMREIIERVDELYQDVKHLPAREAAAKMNFSNYFGLVMAKFNGKTPQYEKFFRAHMLKQRYGLAPLGAMLGRMETEDAEG